MLPDKEVGAVHVAIAIALHVRGVAGATDVVAPSGEIGRVHVAVFVEVGFQRGYDERAAGRVTLRRVPHKRAGERRQLDELLDVMFEFNDANFDK